MRGNWREDLKTTLIGLATLAGLIIVVIGTAIAFAPAPTPEQIAAREARIAAAAAEAKAKAEACARDAECATEDVALDAAAACVRPVEALAKYDVQWIGGMTPKFPARVWLDDKHNVVVLVGAGIKFQNGFGAWQRHSYECYYDLSRKEAVGAKAYPYNG